MRKERKDFPTTLKYKFYVLSQQFPQSFKNGEAKLQSYLEPVNRQNFIQHIDKDDSKTRQLQNLAISEVKPLQENQTNALNIDVDELSMIRQAKDFMDCLNKAKSCEQKVEKHQKKEQISLRDFSTNPDPNHRFQKNIQMEQKKQVKGQVKKQKQLVNIKNGELEKPKSFMQEYESNQSSLVANKKKKINLEKSSDEEQQQRIRKLREKGKQSTGRKLNQTAVSIANKNQSMNLSLGEIGIQASSKGEKMGALAKKQHENKQTKIEDIKIKQNGGNIVKTVSQKDWSRNKMPPFPFNQNKGIQQNKNQSKTSEMNRPELSIEQQMLQNYSASEASSKIKRQISSQYEREGVVENIGLKENKLLQSQVKHSKVENKFFQDGEQQQIQSFLPYMEQTEDQLQKQVSKDKQQKQIKQIGGQSQKENQLEGKNKKQEQYKEPEAEQKKIMSKISDTNQQNCRNEAPADKMSKSASYQQQSKLCQNKSNYSMNQFNRPQKQNELKQLRKLSNCSSEQKSNKLVSRFLVDYQKQTGRNWIKSQINQQKNNLSSQNNCKASNKDRQQMEQVLFNKFNTIIESLKNELMSSQDCIKKLSQRLETQQERVKQMSAKNKDLVQSSMIHAERIEQLEKQKQEMTKHMEQNNKEIKEFKMQMQNYQKQNQIYKQLMRQKMDVMDVQLARLNIRLGDMLSVVASPKGVTKKNKQG